MNEEMERAIKAVTEEYGITADDLTAGSRVKPLPEARQMFMYVLRKRVSYNRLSKRINRDRGYVRNALKTMDGLILVYKDVRGKYNNIMDKMGYDD